jgi:hypothetical protein
MWLCCGGYFVYALLWTETHLSITDIVLLSLILASMMGMFAFYPIYVIYIYYQYEKNVRIEISYVERELRYIVSDKIEQMVKFEDVVHIEYWQVHGIAPKYHRIILKSGETIIITSLLLIDGLFPIGIKTENILSWHLIPNEWYEDYD